MDERDLYVDVPVFPLPHVVLFPEARLPLHIFEPRYRAMLKDCLSSADRAMIIAQVERGGAGRIADVAGMGVIVEHQPLGDGRSNIIVEGRARVRVEELQLEDEPRYPYKRARARRLTNVSVSVHDADRAALLAAASMFAAEVKKHDPSFAFQLPRASDAATVADTCACQLVVDANVRQAILEELDPRIRVRLVMQQLALQHGAMIGETKGAVLN
jgi:Lon protease-like protein